MMRTFFVGLIFVGAFIFSARDIDAQCDCAGATTEMRGSRYHTAFEELRHSEVVFVGEVLEVKEVERPPAHEGAHPYEQEIKFKVKRAWKKEVEKVVSVRASADSCIIGFEKGEEYLVYAIADANVLRTWYCSRTRLLSKAAKDLEEFEEKGEKPIKVYETESP